MSEQGAEVVEIDRCSNARTGFNEPAEVGRYEVTYGNETKRVLAIRQETFRIFGSVLNDPTWGYEARAYEATEQWEMKRTHHSPTYLFDFSTERDVTWSEIEQEIEANLHYLFTLR